VLIRCCGNVSSDPLPSNGYPSTVVVTSGTYLLSRCLTMVICVKIYILSLVICNFNKHLKEENYIFDRSLVRVFVYVLCCPVWDMFTLRYVCNDDALVVWRADETLAPERSEASPDRRNRAALPCFRLHWIKKCSKWEREWEINKEEKRGRKLNRMKEWKYNLKMGIILPNSEIFITVSHFSQNYTVLYTQRY
jgi:hypothetical protein